MYRQMCFACQYTLFTGNFMDIGSNLGSWSVRNRLEFIDLRLFWQGRINRSDIMNRFGVSMPQASKDLALFQAMAPDSLQYSLSEKKYFASKSYSPIFIKPDADMYFWQMRDDVHPVASAASVWLSEPPAHDMVCFPHRNVNPLTLREIVVSLEKQQVIEIMYQSMSGDDPAVRPISPHAFAFDGHRWHVRAFCHVRNKYRDFLLSRILKVGQATLSYVPGSEDIAWNEFFDLVLKPHPDLTASQKSAVADDYQMVDGKLKLNIRLALLYYYLRRLGLDEDGKKRPAVEQHVVVANEEETEAAVVRVKYVS
jgi:hypothetical protein